MTHAGVQAIEEATAAGVTSTRRSASRCPQAIAVAEAVERGLKRREAAGEDVSAMTPGVHDDDRPPRRLDAGARRSATAWSLDPGYANWAGIACLKKAYGIFQERGYRARLLAAAYRHHLHWSELIGGDIVLTIPYKWQRLFNASDIEVRPRMDDPVPERDRRRALPAVAGLPPGLRRRRDDAPRSSTRSARPCARCAGSSRSYHDLVAVIRDFMLPNPDHLK